MYEDMTPEEQFLFDELQREIEELRRLLAQRDMGAIKKVGVVIICIIKNKYYYKEQKTNS